MTVKELTLTDNYEIVHLGDPEAIADAATT